MSSMIKVANDSPITRVAGAIAKQLRVQDQAVLQAIGAGAVNQAVKAIIIARSYLERDHLDLWMVPEFSVIETNGESITAIRFFLHRSTLQ